MEKCVLVDCYQVVSIPRRYLFAFYAEIAIKQDSSIIFLAQVLEASKAKQE